MKSLVMRDSIKHGVWSMGIVPIRNSALALTYLQTNNITNVQKFSLKVVKEFVECTVQCTVLDVI